jgi:hypothetical protein
MGRLRWLLGLLALLAAPVARSDERPPAAAPGEAGPETWDPTADPDHSAVPDTWPMQDACPARTRATRGRALLDATETAWTFTPPGPIEGDPRVWGDWVVVASRSARDDQTRELDVLRLTDGRRFAHRSYRTSRDLEPVILRDRVHVRRSPDEFETLKIAPVAGMLVPEGRFPVPGWVVFARAARFEVSPEGVRRVEGGAATGRVRWTAPLEGRPVAPPGLAGRFLHVLTQRRVEGFQGLENLLESFELETGRRSAASRLGWTLRDRTRPESAVPGMVAGTREMIVTLPAAVEMADDAASWYVRTALHGGYASGETHFELRGRPFAWGPHTVFALQHEGRPHLAATRLDAPVLDRGWSFQILAGPGRHERFLDRGAPATVAAGVAIHPAGVFEVGSRRIRGPSPWPRARSVVPARETMLTVVDEGMRLVAWRSPSPPPEGGPVMAVPAGADRLVVRGAAAATLDGARSRGALTLLGAGGKVAGIGKQPIGLDEVGLVLDEADRIVHGPDAGFVARWLPVLAARSDEKTWNALAQRTKQAGDEALAEEVDAEIERRLGRPGDVARTVRERSSKPSPVVVAEVRRRLDDVRRAEADLAWRAFASLPDTVSMAYRADVLRAVLGLAPGHADALAWLRSRLPEGVVPPDVREPLEWLDVVVASSDAPLGRVRAGAGTPEERRVAHATATWREDLVGLRSERLLLLTPVSRPGPIARCLTCGEIACRELDRIFGVDPKTGAGQEALTIHLLESAAEYARMTRGMGGEDRGLEWTLGHYRPAEGVSYLFVPDGEDAFEKVIPTLVHELTHHWLDRRLPVDRRRASGLLQVRLPGYFLEEGFATLVEECRIDLRRRAVTCFDARANSLDVVANSPRLLPWGRVFEASQADFAQLSREPSVEVPMRWVLGHQRRMSDTNLFYMQGAAACWWLFHAEEGKNRGVLLDWIRDLHAGRTQPGDVQRRLGTTAEALGEAVRSWCRHVSGEAR